MDLIINNNYLSQYIITFLDIPTTIYMACVSIRLNQLLKHTSRYKTLLNCLPKCVIYGNRSKKLFVAICRKGTVESFNWYITSFPSISSLINKKNVLSECVRYGNLQMVKYLSSNVLTEEWWTGNIISDIDFIRGDKLYVSYCSLVEIRYIDSLFLTAVLNNRIELANYFLNKGADIHAQDNIVLTLNSTTYNLNIIKYLINIGFGVNASNNLLLKTAIKNNRQDIINFLLENGADINTRDCNLLEGPVYSNNLKMVQYLLNVGFNSKIHIDYAFGIAMGRNYVDIIKLLVNRSCI
jgi:ankyrin repeat protein